MYADSFLIPVRTADKDAYAEISRAIAARFIAHGATRVLELWGDEIPDGEVTSFRKAVALSAEETLVLTLNIFPDKPTRDAAMKALAADDELTALLKRSPVDNTRVIFGGFAPLLDVSA